MKIYLKINPVSHEEIQNHFGHLPLRILARYDVISVMVLFQIKIHAITLEFAQRAIHACKVEGMSLTFEY